MSGSTSNHTNTRKKTRSCWQEPVLPCKGAWFTSSPLTASQPWDMTSLSHPVRLGWLIWDHGGLALESVSFTSTVTKCPELRPRGWRKVTEKCAFRLGWMEERCVNHAGAEDVPTAELGPVEGQQPYPGFVRTPLSAENDEVCRRTWSAVQGYCNLQVGIEGWKGGERLMSAWVWGGWLGSSMCLVYSVSDD